jgi:hypothetical protein
VDRGLPARIRTGAPRGLQIAVFLRRLKIVTAWCWSLPSRWHRCRQGIPRSTSTAKRTPDATRKRETWCRFQPNRSLGLLRGKPSERWCISPNGDCTPGCTDADRMCVSDGTFRSAGQLLTEFVTLYHSCRVFCVILSLVIALQCRQRRVHSYPQGEPPRARGAGGLGPAKAASPALFGARRVLGEKSNKSGRLTL